MNKPAAQLEIDELKAKAITPSEQEDVENRQAELDAARAEHFREIGEATVPELVEQADGTVVTKEEAQAIIDSGNPSGPYPNGRR